MLSVVILNVAVLNVVMLSADFSYAECLAPYTDIKQLLSIQITYVIFVLSIVYGCTNI